MARSKQKSDAGMRTQLADVTGQFRGLDMRDPAGWPAAPKGLLLVAIAVLVVVAAWFAVLQAQNEQLESEHARETSLRTEYSTKLQKAVSLDGLRKQREQVLQYVNLMEKQLPSKSEMDALLSDINQAGLGRSLQFDLFKPGDMVTKDYYAELPIALKVTGRYHDIGAFTADVANLSRIVTLNDLTITPVADKDKAGAGDLLQLNATAKTYRYLDPDEVQAQKAAKEAGKKK